MVQTLSAEQANIEMDVNWSTFIQTKVNTFTKWDLVRFFHDNPHTKDTADNIAGSIGRDVAPVLASLDELVRTGILDSETRKTQIIYRLSTKKDTRQTITEFIKACHNREFRVKAIHTVLQSKRSH
jgi:predicted transcriptional regulator